jgi:hypothetical protein
MEIAALAQVTLPDLSLAPRRLGSFWADRSCVLVFLRHFG